MEFQYIKERYKVPAEMNREVIVDGKKGVITKDMGNYIGVNFYDNITAEPLACHPTWEVQYLESFNHKPPIKKLTSSAKRYREWLTNEGYGMTYAQFIGVR
jgi:hypothetical protein